MREVGAKVGDVFVSWYGRTRVCADVACDCVERVRTCVSNTIRVFVSEGWGAEMNRYRIWE